MKLAVSILSSDYDEEETIRRINETNADYLHVDVTDGSFVPTKTPQREFLHTSKKPLNVHLMVSRPFDFISVFKELQAESITIQAELEDDLDSLLRYIRSLGMKCGLALCPSTDIAKIEEYVGFLDEVLILSVEPGRGGQKIIEAALDKIDELAKLREKTSAKFEIFVDGGVNGENIDKVKGADAVVVGSYICKSENYQAQIDKLGL